MAATLVFAAGVAFREVCALAARAGVNAATPRSAAASRTRRRPMAREGAFFTPASWSPA
jgi:hypothetical protein